MTIQIFFRGREGIAALALLFANHFEECDRNEAPGGGD